MGEVFNDTAEGDTAWDYSRSAITLPLPLKKVSFSLIYEVVGTAFVDIANFIFFKNSCIGNGLP